FIRFFFQAEDGIRGFHVTGVQTCALPISFAAPPAWMICWSSVSLSERLVTKLANKDTDDQQIIQAGGAAKVALQVYAWQPDVQRSEERRVGKECGAGCVGEAWRRVCASEG